MSIVNPIRKARLVGYGLCVSNHIYIVKVTQCSCRRLVQRGIFVESNGDISSTNIVGAAGAFIRRSWCSGLCEEGGVVTLSGSSMGLNVDVLGGVGGNTGMIGCRGCSHGASCMSASGVFYVSRVCSGKCRGIVAGVRGVASRRVRL